MNKRNGVLSGCADFLAQSVLVFNLRDLLGIWSSFSPDVWQLPFFLPRYNAGLYEQVSFSVDLNMNHKALKQLVYNVK